MKQGLRKLHISKKGAYGDRNVSSSDTQRVSSVNVNNNLTYEEEGQFSKVSERGSEEEEGQDL